ncbi:MAG: hypothetical protein C4K58_06825 [Flavobacteriaceae bacterium]|nr:MAG: hypothetical protein C4K58_06825 [Flavobacteriaceae bacterium]
MNSIDLSKLSEAELKAALKEKQKEGKAQELAKKKDFNLKKNLFVSEMVEVFEESNFALSKLKESAHKRANERKERLKSLPKKVGIEEIRKFFKTKFESRGKAAYALLDAILSKNNAGDYDPKLLVKLRGQVREINDETLTKAFEQVEESLVVVGTSTYVRVYKKDNLNKWKDISLNFSAL